MNTSTTDLAAQVAAQRDRLTETVSAIADNFDANDLRTRAEAGAADLLDNATDADGRPKRGLLIGALVLLGALVLARKFLR